MDIANIIIILVFVGLVLILMLELLNRAILAIIGGLICFLTLKFIKGEPFSLIVSYLFGSPEDGYVNLHSILLIFGMTIIVQICHKAGVFKFIAFKLVLSIIDRTQYLLLILCTITLILSALLNNILTVMIVIPLIITISRILNIDPEPLIITQAVLVNIGGTVFAISSIPNILITNSANIEFNEFFLNVGILSIVIFIITVGFFYILYYGKINVPKENVKILKEFNPWNFVQNRSLLLKSATVLLLVIIGFTLIPSDVLSADIIALIGAMMLVLISKLDIDKIVQELEMDIFIYLLGVFIIAGSVEYTGLLEKIGIFLSNLSGGNFFVVILLILWSSAILSSTIDNIPITKVLIPSIDSITATFTGANKKLAYYSLSIGANWGDNLTPMGDNILVMNLAEKNKRPIRMIEFWKVGFVTTIIQLIFATVYFTLITNIIAGLIFLVICCLLFAFLSIWYISKQKGTTLGMTFQNISKKIFRKTNYPKSLKIKRTIKITKNEEPSQEEK